jgi:transposase-like protein
LSIAEFCREEDVSPASFYRWRKHFGDQVGGIEGSPLFVPVQLVTGDRPTEGVQIELPGGAIVRLPVEASAELVTTAIQAATSRGPREEGVSC